MFRIGDGDHASEIFEINANWKVELYNVLNS